jgi:hypothetical protein
MDTYLEELATTISEEIDRSSKGVKIICSIPTKPDQHFLSKLIEMGAQQSKEDVKSAKIVKEHVMKLWDLEAAVTRDDDSNRKQSFSGEIDEKLRVSINEAVIELVLLSQNLSPSVQQYLNDFKNDQVPKPEEETCRMMQKLEEYLNRVKDIGCKEISTSVRKDEQITSIIFKLIERCNNLEEEKVKMTAFINKKESKINDERMELNEIIDGLTNLLEQEKMELQELEEAQRHRINSIISEEERKHLSSTTSLKSELTRAQQELRDALLSHSVEQKDSMQQRTSIEDKISKLVLQHDSEEKGIKDEIQDLTEKIANETTERDKLEKLIALQVENDDIVAKEKAIIQSVIDLETETDNIIYKAASSLQKLYRGMRDRALVKRLKKKSRKKGKSKKKK